VRVGWLGNPCCLPYALYLFYPFSFGREAARKIFGKISARLVLDRKRKAGLTRVLRGGSWNNDPDNLLATNRNDNTPENRNNNVGFRVVRVCALVGKVSSGYGEVRRGRWVCVVSAKKGLPNPVLRAPHGENTRRRAVAGRPRGRKSRSVFRGCISTLLPFWSAPAERSGDGALGISCVTLLSKRKRCRASLATALHKRAS
jgi:Sulfatase-modifying factor enzyme 1